MATAIHHGPPGSFKSFSLVQRFALAALLAGRTVITNIRSFSSLEKIMEHLPDHKFPSTARLYFVDTTQKDNRLLMACWYKWAPFKAMIIIDEAQRIYPDRRDFKLESLDQYQVPPGMFDIEILPEHRPEDVFTAYDMQRHFEWDIFLSTPNIAKIKREIREVAEWAYRHRSLSKLLPWLKDTWYEHQHDPENNGKAISHRVGAPRRYKADPRVFEIYQSTATGEITDSQAGTTVLSDSSIRTKLLFVVLAILLSLGLFVFKLLQHSPDKAAPVSAATQPAVLPAEIPATHKNNSGQDTQPSSNLLPAGLPARQVAPVSALSLSSIISVSNNDLKDRTKLAFNVLTSTGDLASVSIENLFSLLKTYKVNDTCNVNLFGLDNVKYTITCFNIDEVCSAELKNKNRVIRKHCAMRQQQHPQQAVTNALQQTLYKSRS